MPKLTFKSTFPVSPKELFAWHERDGAINRLTPPWIRTEVKEWHGIRDGSRAVLQVSKGPFTSEWVAVHEEYIQGRQFVDYQERGPFQYWQHVHKFEASGSSGTQLTDVIDFQMPGGDFGERLAAGFIRKEIERAFAYRHRIIGQDLLVHNHYNPSRVSLRIGITGSSGLIGSELASFFSSGGHKITRITRQRSAKPGDVYWNPDTGEIDRAGLENLDVVIHLAGENVLSLRWDEAKKKRIRDSRVKGTHLLADALASLNFPPTVLVTASGLSVYGSHGSSGVSEASALKPGGFLSSVAKEWEAAAEPAVKKGIRTVFLRLGIVLTPRGGVLQRILPVFASGLGGSFSGEQWISWISMDDVLGAVYHTIMSTVAGPVNVVSPFPLSAEKFGKSIGRVIRRPVFLRLPRAAVQKTLGEVADEVLLESVKANPEYLITSGYQFLHPQLDGALKHALGRDVPIHMRMSTLG